MISMSLQPHFILNTRLDQSIAVQVFLFAVIAVLFMNNTGAFPSILHQVGPATVDLPANLLPRWQ